MYGDYKQIVDYQKGTSHNHEYVSMTPTERVGEGLPRYCNKQLYDMLNEFQRNRPVFIPLHTQDFQTADDNVYIPDMQHLEVEPEELKVGDSETKSHPNSFHKCYYTSYSETKHGES